VEGVVRGTYRHALPFIVFFLILFSIFRHRPICKVCSVGGITYGFVTILELQNLPGRRPGLLLFPAPSKSNLVIRVRYFL
jgi:hypothetical protein